MTQTATVKAKKFTVQYWDGQQWATDLELNNLAIAIQQADHLTSKHHGPDEWTSGGRVFDPVAGYVVH